MINSFYLPLWEGNDLNIYNIYHKGKPMYCVKNMSNREHTENLMNGENIDLNNPFTYGFYERGIIVEKEKFVVIQKLKQLFDNLGPDIDLFLLSFVITRDFFKSKFNFINITPEILGLEDLVYCSNNENPLVNHYIVGYSDSEELNNLEDKITLSEHSTIFLCRIQNGKILEIGPMYKVDKNFCFKCVSDNIAKSPKIIKRETYNGKIKDLISYEYMGGLIDYYSKYITMLSSIHEREIIIKKNTIYHTELIAPISLYCDCMEE